MIDEFGQKSQFDFPLDASVLYRPKMRVRYVKESDSFDLVIHSQELTHREQQKSDLRSSIAALMTGKQPFFHFKNIPPHPQPTEI